MNTRRGERIWLSIVASVAGLVAYNAFVTLPVALALCGEDGPLVWMHRRWFVSPNEIVLDLRDAGPSPSAGLIDRPLFLAAHALASQSFERVVLAYRGQPRFILDGKRFQQIGASWAELDETSGVMMIVTLQDAIMNLDGRAAFPNSRSFGPDEFIQRGVANHLELHLEWWGG